MEAYIYRIRRYNNTFQTELFRRRNELYNNYLQSDFSFQSNIFYKIDFLLCRLSEEI